jgi:hypothetical protein
MQHLNDRGLPQPHHFAVSHRSSRRHAAGLSCKTTFATEFASAQNSHHGLLALGGDDADFSLAPLNIEHSVCRFALCKESGVLCVAGNGSAAAGLRKKYPGIKLRLVPGSAGRP